MKKKTIALILSCVLVLGCAIGGTIAWLTDKTAEIKNTFTVGNVDIDLKETTTDYKMVPGITIAKDPTVTVNANSEACWLFVKVEESDNFGTFMTYAMADGWTKLTDKEGVYVYYREVTASGTDKSFPVLSGETTKEVDGKTVKVSGTVTVKDTVTKKMMDELTAEPTLTFTAYAVQRDGIDTAAAAWEKITNPTTNEGE